MKVAYVFPGQGSQWVGMGRDLYDTFASARDIFHEADEILGFPLSRLCFEGGEDELRQTSNVQPAMVTVSLACLKALQEGTDSLPSPAFVAGHSLGEYTALAAAGAVSHAGAVYLARERGRLMHEAGQQQPGGMVAVMGMDEDSLSGICRKTGTVIANFNCPGQLVISGRQESLSRAVTLIESRGTSRLRPLKVSGAFHSELMQSAVHGMLQVLGSVSMQQPEIPIVANTMAQPVNTVEEIKAELLNQLCHSIQWQRSIEYMINAGVGTFIEIGPGKVLAGLIRRINKDVKTINISDAAAIKDFAG